MGHSNSVHTDGNGSNWITRHPLLVSAIIYALLCIPIYFWLQGPVRAAGQGTVTTVGRVPVSVAIGGLVLGSILIVPAIMTLLQNRFAIDHKFNTEQQ